MELIRISGDKIKISLTKAELDAYDLSVDSISYSHAQTKRAFRELFVEAREQTGFDTDKEKVFVQIFRAKNGGCEIFISKITNPSLKRARESQKQINIYKFEELDSIISACRALERLRYSDRSSVYVCDGMFYLWLDTENDAALAYAEELGGYEQSISPFYISEHFSVICENDAVNILSKF